MQRNCQGSRRETGAMRITPDHKQVKCTEWGGATRSVPGVTQGEEAKDSKSVSEVGERK